MRNVPKLCAAILVIGAAGCASSENTADVERTEAAGPIGPRGMGAADALGWSLYQTEVVAAGRNEAAWRLASHPDERN